MIGDNFRQIMPTEALARGLGLDREARLNAYIKTLKTVEPGGSVCMTRDAAQFLLECADYPLLADRALGVELKLQTLTVQVVNG